MSDENGQPRRSYDALSYSITRLYPGKHIVYSEDEQRVIGVGDTPEEAAAQAQASGVRGMWHYGYGEVPGIRKV